MDISYVLDRRLAVGGGIWTAAAMAELARAGFTHVLNLQAEFDETELARAAGLEPYWLPVEDDLQEKPPELFEQAARFGQRALSDPRAQLYVHCAAGIHRGPLAAAAILCGLGWEPEAAMDLVRRRRMGAEFPETYALNLHTWLASSTGALV
ncbi:MAG: protein-tyrosine phosphatase family protein [Terriglobales bacterium]